MLNLFRKKEKTEESDEINISDGEIVSSFEGESPERQDSEGILEKTELPESVLPEEPEELAPEPLLEEPSTSGQADQIEPQPASSSPITIPDVPEIEPTDSSDTDISVSKYFPCYLIDGSSEDFGAFREYLRSSGKSQATQHEYGVVLRRWRKAFENQHNDDDPAEFSVNLLNRIFESHKNTVALKMKYTLSAYARYRESIHDPRLLYLLTAHKSEIVTPTPKTIKQPTRNPTDTLSEAEAQSYEDLGRFLIKQGKREGIWLLMCLWGVKPSEIKDIEFPNKSNIGFVRGSQVVKIKVPKWFMDACVSVKRWRLNRQNIHKGLMALEVAPRVLNAVAKQREKEAEQQKKEQQKDLEKMVKRWRKNRPQ